MLPQAHHRKKKNDSKVNLTISLVFHVVLVGALFYFAAREGLIGKRLQKIAVHMVKEEKPPEKPKDGQAQSGAAEGDPENRAAESGRGQAGGPDGRRAAGGGAADRGCAEF